MEFKSQEELLLFLRSLKEIGFGSQGIYYYNPKTATNKWIRTRPVVTTIGSHVFCK